VNIAGGVASEVGRRRAGPRPVKAAQPPAEYNCNTTAGRRRQPDGSRRESPEPLAQIQAVSGRGEAAALPTGGPSEDEGKFGVLANVVH
jgi:hypothetical protein